MFLLCLIIGDGPLQWEVPSIRCLPYVHVGGWGPVQELESPVHNQSLSSHVKIVPAPRLQRCPSELLLHKYRSIGQQSYSQRLTMTLSWLHIATMESHPPCHHLPSFQEEQSLWNEPARADLWREGAATYSQHNLATCVNRYIVCNPPAKL